MPVCINSSVAPVTVTVNQPRCSSCGQLGHARKTHRSCPYNPSNMVVDANMTDNNPISEHPQNHRYPARMFPSEFRPVANASENILADGRHYFGEMSATCPFCRAKTWIDERYDSSIANPKYSFCCNKGKVSLSLPSPPPALLLSLLTGQDDRSKSFRSNIRAYNSAFAFASIGAQVCIFSFNMVKHISLMDFVFNFQIGRLRTCQCKFRCLYFSCEWCYSPLYRQFNGS